MASLTTFDLTLADLRQYLNPSYDLNGIQIGNLFALTAVDSTTARTSATTLTLAPGLPFIGANMLEGYRLFINSDYDNPYHVLANGEPDENGDIVITTQETLPVAGSDWSIVCRHTRIDLSDAFAQSKIEEAVNFIRASLKVDYTKMLSMITGQLLWSRDMIGYAGDNNLAIPLAFYKATNVHVWSGLKYDYANRRADAQELVEGTDFTVTHDDEAKTSLLTLAEEPEEGTVIACDYFHTCDPMPKTLQRLAMDAAKSRVLQQLASVRPDVTFDMIEKLDAYVATNLKVVAEFDAIELYRETRTRPQHGYGNITILRG